MKRNFLRIFLLLALSGTCCTFASSCKTYSVKVVKNKKRWRPYDSKKDRKKVRTKVVRYKSRK